MPQFRHIEKHFTIVLCLLIGLLWTPGLHAQMSPEEHASHHPDQQSAVPAAKPSVGTEAKPGSAPGAKPDPMSGMSGMGGTSAASTGPAAMGTKPDAMSGMGGMSTPSSAASPTSPGMGGKPGQAGGMGSMMSGMGAMMKGMMGGPPPQLYPSLMALPATTSAQRLQLQQQAAGRATTGAALLQQGTARLANPASSDLERQDGAADARAGLQELESGEATRRALAEGRPPRAVALQWFKSEMNLESPMLSSDSHTIFGVTPFHLFTMLMLVVFALAMVVMYFFKMRRAASLFGRLDSERGSPSGAFPPLGGTSAPPSPDVPPVEKPVPKKFNKELDKAPMTANWRGQLRVGSIVTETPNVKTFRLLPSSNDRFLPFNFVPGQFLNVAFAIGGARMNRSYSISSSPTERDHVDLTVRREPRGAISRHIVDLLKVGDLIETGGPVGKFTFNGTESDSIVLISGGVGITPMMSISRYLTELAWPGDIFFIYVCRTSADIVFADEIAALQRRNPHLHFAVTLTRAQGTDWKGARGRISKEWLVQTVPDLASRRTHVCGPPEMMDSIKAIFNELGIAPDHLKMEAFGAVKPAPAVPGAAKPIGPATGPLVTFSKNNKSAKIHLDLQTGDSPPLQSILELSEELSIGIEFSCRVGTCGICKVKLTAGEVDQEVQDALDDDDKAKGIILACQAKPKGDVTVEA